MVPRPFPWLRNRRGKRIMLGSRGPFGLFKTPVPLKAFDTHMYIVGKTKKGKSQFLNHLAFQLISQSQGVGLIDPHGDLVNNLLAYLASYPKDQPWLSVPENRRRILYVDATREDYVVPFNVLATDDEPYITAQNVIEAMRRTWAEELRAAPRFANVALHSLLVLIEMRLSLVELPRLLADKDYRDSLLANVGQPDVAAFFHQRFDRWGREQPLMVESLLNKVTALTLNPYLRPVLGARDNRLTLRTLMDDGRILLVNLRTPEEETRNLLGSLLMTSFEQAALSRADVAENKRRPFFLIVDEFQKFAATSGSVATIAEILSECRKYGLYLCFAHQSWAQLEAQRRLVGALEQAQVKVIFGTGRQTAQAIVGELFVPDPTLVKHEVEDEEQQDRTHPVYHPLSEQFEAFTQTVQRLKRRSILVQLPERDDVLQLRTLTVPQSQISREELEEIKTTLARQSGRPRSELEEQIANRAQQETELYHVTDAEPVG